MLKVFLCFLSCFIHPVKKKGSRSYTLLVVWLQGGISMLSPPFQHETNLDS